MPSFLRVPSTTARLAGSAAIALCVAQSSVIAQAIGAAGRPAVTAAVSKATELPFRAIRRDIPVTNAIRRAYAAGTRDSTGRPGRAYWQLRTDYRINVALDPASQRLTGSARITIHNNSPDALSVIGLRLDPNHFLGNAPHAAPWVPAEVTDGMVISRLVVDGKAANLAAVDAPAGGRGGAAAAPITEPVLQNGKSTVARVRLPQPIAPNATSVLEIDWSHKLPGGPGSGHRMVQRWADTLFQPTQWYPRVAVYDDLRGWDSELYLGPSEFYNNFGTWDVNIDVPAGWIVGGTGVLQNPTEVLTPAARQRWSQVLASNAITTIVGADEIGPGQATAAGTNGRLTWKFHADTVNDFAWATAKKFVWQATRATIPGKSVVPVNMYYLPGHANLYERAGEITRHALEFYSALWFPYQFPQMTLQDGPSAGMEYPMVINSNQGAADHETGHQWWPMTVSNNETWYGWMDEGFNQYMNILSAADVAKRAPRLDGLGQSYGRNSGNEAEPPMMWNANYAGPSSYGFTTYQKTPLMLSMLGGIVSDTAVQRAHREWANAWLFKHPSPWDYMHFMNRALGKDLGWFWYYWLFTTESVDGRLADVKTAGIRTTVTVAQDGQMPSPVVLEVKFAPKGPAIRTMKNAVMTDSVTAVLTWPVDVWMSGKRTFTTDLVFGGRAIEKITLDPQGRFPDRDPKDNVWEKK
jgi:hypothetical protein